MVSVQPVHFVEPMPTHGPLVDRYAREHTDLRISVTDRCNLRCVYCMPEEGVPWRHHAEILNFEEIARVARVAHSLGVSSLRLTGGEPLVRRDVVDLVRLLSDVGFADLALTTNATRLRALAPDLAHAGLNRVNVSCDSLRPERFAELRRRGNLHTVLDGMDAAEEAGLLPLKVNVVMIAGVNEDEILDFCDFARRTGRIVRFIEFLPLSAGIEWTRDRVVSAQHILARVSAAWSVEPVETGGPDSGPATCYRFTDGIGEIGIVPSVTRPFCASCNRLRLTADGSLRNCLFSDAETHLREKLRSSCTDEDLALAIRRSVWGKLPGHGVNDPGFLRPSRSMSMIGG